MGPAVVARWRMRSQLLWGGDAGSAAQVVGHLAAAQAQDLLPASWGVAQRATGLTAARVAAECDTGAVLRSHVLRPTWHFVAAADLRLLLAATAPRVHRANTPYYRRHGLDDEALATVRRVLAAELADGRHRTRDELGAALGGAGLPVTGQALAYALMHAELDGLACSGVARGGRQTYALLDERAPGTSPDRDEALRELARRYFVARGPATERDLAGWASLTLAEARAATRDVAAGLASFDADDETFWHAPGEPPAPRPGRVDLVQGLDELVMSYSRTRQVVAPELGWSQPPPDWARHAVLVDGRVAGRWGYRRERGVPARVVTVPARPWTPAERDGLAAAVAAFSRFVGAPVSWE